MTDITVSVPHGLPEDERRRSVASEVVAKLTKHEREAHAQEYLRTLHLTVNKETGMALRNSDDLIHALARFAQRDLKDKLIEESRTLYPWQKPE